MTLYDMLNDVNSKQTKKSGLFVTQSLTWVFCYSFTNFRIQTILYHLIYLVPYIILCCTPWCKKYNNKQNKDLTLKICFLRAIAKLNVVGPTREGKTKISSEVKSGRLNLLLK